MVAFDKKVQRKKIFNKLKESIENDKANPSRAAKWLKLMECKKNIFAYEDEIDKLTKQLKNKGKRPK